MNPSPPGHGVLAGSSHMKLPVKHKSWHIEANFLSILLRLESLGLFELSSGQPSGSGSGFLFESRDKLMFTCLENNLHLPNKATPNVVINVRSPGCQWKNFLTPLFRLFSSCVCRGDHPKNSSAAKWLLLGCVYSSYC